MTLDELERYSMTLKIFLSVVAVSFLTAFAQPLYAATLTIRQEIARYPSDTVRYPAANTFLIVPVSTRHKQACSGPLAGNCHPLPTVHFGLGSATLTPPERRSLLIGLQQGGIGRTEPLKITGFTCPLGSQQGNSTLSLRRARVVAGVLLANGYTVRQTDIQGRGEEDLLTNDPRKFALNRRVEISRK